MRKVELRMNEENKYLIIKKLVETNGNKNRAAIKLGCTVRTVNRLILKYKKYGKAAFIHGNRGRAPATTIPLDIKNRIIKLYIDHYCDTNFTHSVKSFMMISMLKLVIRLLTSGLEMKISFPLKPERKRERY